MNHRTGNPVSYLDLVEAAVTAYPDDRVARWIGEVARDGVHEHGFPRYTSNVGILLANGRVPEKRETFRRLMSLSCHSAAAGTMRRPGSGGNEFSVRELVTALLAVERAGVFPASDTESWRADLSRIDAARCYSCLPPIGFGVAKNWAVFGCASEQARVAAGLGGDPEHVEKYVADQIRWFDANGMYRDPNQPAVYDFVTRLQFMLVLHLGYDGPSRERLEELLDRAAEPTLAMLSAAGEIPYGGRSNQFLHNNVFFAAVCEWYASRANGRGDASAAARFRAAARAAVDALVPWLAVCPVRHVKNLYPRESGIGCEGYAYFDKYMTTMGSWAAIAMQFAENGEGPASAADDMGGAPVASSFATSPDFHFLFLRAGDYSAQFDWNADPHYDCDGLGRIHRRGAPAAICLSTPCAAHPNYAVEIPGGGDLAIVPVGGGPLSPAGHGSDGSSSWADWTCGTLSWHCRLSPEVLESGLSGPGEVALRLPAFEFDGENATSVSCDGRVLSVRYRNWECRFSAVSEGASIMDAGFVSCNRNGRYRAFEAHGDRRLSVRISIEPADKR